jgi:hypothetical protein
MKRLAAGARDPWEGIAAAAGVLPIAGEPERAGAATKKKPTRRASP